MAYPSGVAFKPLKAPIGAQPIHESSAAQLHPLGSTIRAADATYGEGEFIYLSGAASTAQGDLVAYNSKTGATTRTTAGGTGCNGPVAVAAAAIGSGEYGWYQISGATPVKAATASANTDVYLTSTAGQVDDAVDFGDKVNGAAFKAATSSGFATVQLSRPSVGGDSSSTGTGLATYCTLSAATEAGDAIAVTGQVKTMDGANVAVATAVYVTTLAVTADKGDIAVTTGTGKKIVNPATGPNVCWLETDASGAFVVTVTNSAVEDTIIIATPANGTAQMLKLTFT